MISARAVGWLLFYLIIATAWAVLYLMQLSLGASTEVFGSQFWQSLCISDPAYSNLLVMWLLMTCAMMAPTALPMLMTYDDFRQTGIGTNAGFWALIAGYLLVWAGFSVLAAGLQLAAFDARLVNVVGQSSSPLLSAALLLVAGVYQFSSLKNACLTACQAPLSNLMSQWKPGAFAVFMIGVREGLNCLGCCWALMLLAFVGGTMNIAFMALAMFLMLVEKLSEFDRFITKPLGVLLLASAIFILVI